MLLIYTEYVIASRGGCGHLKIHQLFRVTYSLSSSSVLNDLFSWPLIELSAVCRDCSHVQKRSRFVSLRGGEFVAREIKELVHFVALSCWLSPDAALKGRQLLVIRL